ncbi:hypothetical protein SDC9_106706 [bioreactor metagenome]|uniref:Uncharacterized protein n=1 Tax=bioreactor metagenome TaxID=1076179 RepID=A0A645B323_9ZZZZ
MVGHAVSRGGLARKAADRQAVGAVWGDLKFHRHIVKAQRLYCVGAHRHLFVQYHNAVFDCIREIVHRQPQLTKAAQHTV